MQWTLEELHNWDAIKTYIDSAIIPCYLYKQEVPLQEHVLRMTYLMNLGMEVEKKIKGRVLLFPLHYQLEEQSAQSKVVLPDGFSRYYILRFSGHDWNMRPPETDCFAQYLTVSDSELDSKVRFDITVDVLYEEIISSWKHKSTY